MEQINAVGRRKAAIARVYVKEGTGVITVNKRPLDNYFPNPILQYIVKQPLTTLEVAEKYDIKVNLVGGGYKGQAEALRLAIARALVKINPEDKSALRKEGFMTRDPRAVERRNPVSPRPARDSSSASANRRMTTVHDVSWPMLALHYIIGHTSRAGASLLKSLVSKSHRLTLGTAVATMRLTRAC